MEPGWPHSLASLLALTAKKIEGRVARQSRLPDLLEPYLGFLDGQRLIKVAGTNGKGSLCAMVEACLSDAGLRVGVFTSPHLSRVTERFRVAGREVYPDVVERHAANVLRIVQEFVERHGESHRPSFFECLILIAMHLSFEQKIEVAVFEAGIGGYNDAVSFLPGEFSVITSIGLDHTEQLGDSLEQIAVDKAGIASAGGHLVLGPEVSPALRKIIEEDASPRGVTVYQASLEGLRPHWLGLDHPTEIVMNSHDNAIVKLPLLGRHQVSNFATLVTLIEVLERQGIVRDLSCLRAVENTRWAGRLEVRKGRPCYVIDAAHNEHGLLALMNSLDDLVPYSQRVLLYGASREKNYRACLPHLSELAPQVFLLEGFHRAERASLIADALPPDVKCVRTFSTPRHAVEFFSTEGSLQDQVVIATGSVFMIGRLMESLDSSILEAR